MRNKKNKSVLITGASGGLGQALAREFAENGFSIGIHYYSNEKGALDAEAIVKGFNRKAILLKADVRDSRAVRSMVALFMKEFGRMDVLVNNAGRAADALISNMNDDAWANVLGVNLNGPFFMMREAFPFMRESGEGSVLNILSYQAFRPARGSANYAASKAGLLSLTKSAALEEGANGIRVNAVVPGYHVTDLNRDLFKKHELIIRKKHLLKDLPEKSDFAQFAYSITQLKTVSGQIFPFESRLL